MSPGKVSVGIRASTPLVLPRVETAVLGLKEAGEEWEFGWLDV